MGLAGRGRTDADADDIAPETMGRDFFAYSPTHLRLGGPTRETLARLTNCVQRALADGRFDGGLWLEGSPALEETAYWLNLLIDTEAPIVGVAAHQVHGAIGSDGDRTIVDAVDYIRSRIWADADGRDRIGVVVTEGTRIFTAREVQKADARPGGYIATGGHGGVVGTTRGAGQPALTFVPVKRHTHTSAVSLARLPEATGGVRRDGQGIVTVRVRIKDEQGGLRSTAIPSVAIAKHARYLSADWSRDPAVEVDILARIEQNLRDSPLSGFVGEGAAPYGTMGASVEAALERAIFSGMPVVKVGRGNADGFTPASPDGLFIGGNNLTATKARLLLMACLMAFGGLPTAANPDRPTEEERAAAQAKLAAYRSVFETH